MESLPRIERAKSWNCNGGWEKLKPPVFDLEFYQILLNTETSAAGSTGTLTNLENLLGRWRYSSRNWFRSKKSAKKIVSKIIKGSETNSGKSSMFPTTSQSATKMPSSGPTSRRATTGYWSRNCWRRDGGGIWLISLKRPILFGRSGSIEEPLPRCLRKGVIETILLITPPRKRETSLGWLQSERSWTSQLSAESNLTYLCESSTTSDQNSIKSFHQIS